MTVAKLPYDIDYNAYSLLSCLPRAVYEATRKEISDARNKRAVPLNDREAVALSLMDENTADWLLIRSQMDRASVTETILRTLDRAISDIEHRTMAGRIKERRCAQELIKALECGRVTSAQIYGMTIADLEPVAGNMTNEEKKEKLDWFWQLKERNIEEE